MATAGTLRTCRKGHQFYKSSACPACPVCEEERNPENCFLGLIAAPSRRALERENIKTLQDLSKWTERDILNLHGMGPGTIPKLKKALRENGFAFKS